MDKYILTELFGNEITVGNYIEHGGRTYRIHSFTFRPKIGELDVTVLVTSVETAAKTLETVTFNYGVMFEKAAPEKALKRPKNTSKLKKARTELLDVILAKPEDTE